MLARQIGSTAPGGLSDAAALLDASGRNPGVLPTGGNRPAALGGTAIGATTLLPTPADTVTPLLWAGAGVGTALLLSGALTGHTMAGTKGKSLLPIFLVGGGIALWYFMKPAAAATVIPPTGGGGGGASPIAEDPAITARLATWSNAPQFPRLAGVVSALGIPDRETLYTILTQYFDKGVPLTADLQTFWNNKLAAATT